MEKKIHKESIQINTNRKFKKIIKHKEFYIMLAPALLYFIIFHYLPMYGIIFALKDIQFNDMFNSPWNDPLMENFQKVFADPYFMKVLINTITISVYRLIFIKT